jgi:hypothetical protein
MRVDTASVFVDTDATATTGGPGGAELRVDFTDHGNRTSFAVWKSGSWVGAKFPTALILPPNLDVFFGPTAELDLQSLGDPTAVNLWAEASGGGRTDRLPDAGTIHYDVQPLVLSVASFKPTAGKLRERLELVVNRSDSGEPLIGELPLCSAHVGGKVVFAKLAAPAKSDAPAAVCDWRFPKAMIGKKGIATITLTSSGRTVKRSVAFTVHR